jgi:hypothetical protein
MLDVAFREDECRVRTGNAALNLNILRKMASRRLRKMKYGEEPGQRQTPHDARGPEFGFLV